MNLNVFKSEKKERPYLKVCTKCSGKGQESSYNNQADKIYGSCTKCTGGSALRGGLGVTLKCSCSQLSTHYEFVSPAELPYIKGIEKSVVKALTQYQAELGSEARAICLMCDCGARYLIRDEGERRKLKMVNGGNEQDKEHNIRIAEALAERGIARVLKPSPTPAVK